MVAERAAEASVNLEIPAGGIDNAPVSDEEIKLNLDDKPVAAPKVTGPVPEKKKQD